MIQLRPWTESYCIITIAPPAGRNQNGLEGSPCIVQPQWSSLVVLLVASAGATEVFAYTITAPQAWESYPIDFGVAFTNIASVEVSAIGVGGLQYGYCSYIRARSTWYLEPLDLGVFLDSPTVASRWLDLPALTPFDVSAALATGGRAAGLVLPRGRSARPCIWRPKIGTNSTCTGAIRPASICSAIADDVPDHGRERRGHGGRDLEHREGALPMTTRIARCRSTRCRVASSRSRRPSPGRAARRARAAARSSCGGSPRAR